MSPSAPGTSACAGQVFCTLFDSNYLVKGVVMLDTLHRHAPDASIYVLCMDDRAHELMLQLAMPSVRLLRLTNVEDDDLRRVKDSRSQAEYCWTMSPVLCRHVIDICPSAEFVTYLDADLMFFSSLAPLFAELGEASIVVTEHRYPRAWEHLGVYGRFNVQWVGFRRDEIGIACLDRWRAQCIEWCHAWLAEGRLGDQKYLDEWPERYGSAVHVVAHAGAGVGPWNAYAAVIDRNIDGIRINGQPLIFYHYHGFQMLSDGHAAYMPPLFQAQGPVPMDIYRPYEVALARALEQVRQLDATFAGGIRSARAMSVRRWVQQYAPPRVKNLLRRLRF